MDVLHESCGLYTLQAQAHVNNTIRDGQHLLGLFPFP